MKEGPKKKDEKIDPELIQEGNEEGEVKDKVEDPTPMPFGLIEKPETIDSYEKGLYWKRYMA